MHVFPIIGNEIGAKEKIREKVKEIENEIEKDIDMTNRLLARDASPLLSPLPPTIHVPSAASVTTSEDPSSDSHDSAAEEMEGDERIVRSPGMTDIDPFADLQSTPSPSPSTHLIADSSDSSRTSSSTSTSTSTSTSSSTSTSRSVTGSVSSPPLHPPQSAVESYTDSAPSDQPVKAEVNTLTSFRLDANSVSVASAVIDGITTSRSETDSNEQSLSFVTSDAPLTISSSGPVDVEEEKEGDGGNMGRDASSVDAQGVEVEVGGQGSVRRKYSYSDEELDEEDSIDDIALAPSSTLDKKKAGQASRDFPYHPAFQPVFSIVEKDKSEDFTPDSYYDQFKNEKQYFLQDQIRVSSLEAEISRINTDNSNAAGAGTGTGAGTGRVRMATDTQSSSMDSTNVKQSEGTAAEDVRRLMRELREEAVFRDIDRSHRRGIMESIWEEIKDAEAVTVSSLSDWLEDREGNDEDDDDEDRDEDDENDDDVDIEDD